MSDKLGKGGNLVAILTLLFDSFTFVQGIRHFKVVEEFLLFDSVDGVTVDAEGDSDTSRCYHPIATAEMDVSLSSVSVSALGFLDKVHLNLPEFLLNIWFIYFDLFHSTFLAENNTTGCG